MTVLQLRRRVGRRANERAGEWATCAIDDQVGIHQRAPRVSCLRHLSSIKDRTAHLFCDSFNHELRWSETGDRYIISLFRDYVFHQVDETHNPLVNLTHVITCLNKVSQGGSVRPAAQRAHKAYSLTARCRDRRAPHARFS